MESATLAPKPDSGPVPPPEWRGPDFFIVGAARSGTTSMWQYLRQHPAVFMSDSFAYKEPSYFCHLYGVREWYWYLWLFREARPDQLIGDASTPYLTSPESAGLIKAARPEARILVLLRNPADRAWSLFKFMRENGYAAEPDFAEALAAENKRLSDTSFLTSNGQYYWNFLYFHSGLYAAQVARYFEQFGRDRVKVLLFEEMVRSPLAAAREAFEFIGVDPTFEPTTGKHNASATEAGCEAAIRKQLLDRYQPDIATLGRLLGRDLTSLWR